MLIVTTIYYAGQKPARQPSTGKTNDRDHYEIQKPRRNVVTVYQGTNRFCRVASHT